MYVSRSEDKNIPVKLPLDLLTNTADLSFSFALNMIPVCWKAKSLRTFPWSLAVSLHIHASNTHPEPLVHFPQPRCWMSFACHHWYIGNELKTHS